MKVNDNFLKYDWVHQGVDTWESFEALRPMENELMSILNPYEGGNLLEIGCGYGRSALRFAEKNVNVLGIDDNEQAIIKFNKFAKNKNLNAKGLSKDVLGFKIHVSDWDVVVCEYTFHCMSEPDAKTLLDSIMAGTKNKGLNLITDFTSEGEAFDNSYKKKFFLPEIAYLKDRYISSGWEILKQYDCLEPTKLGPMQRSTQFIARKF